MHLWNHCSSFAALVLPVVEQFALTALAPPQSGHSVVTRGSPGNSIAPVGKENPRWTSRFPSIMGHSLGGTLRFHLILRHTGVRGHWEKLQDWTIGNHIEMEKGVGLTATRAQMAACSSDGAQVAACSKVQCSSRDPHQLPCTIWKGPILSRDLGFGNLAWYGSPTNRPYLPWSVFYGPA